MVNKYRVTKMIDFGVPADEVFIYDPIGDIYRKGTIAVTKKFIENWKGYFDPIPEVEVEVNYSGGGEYTIRVTMPDIMVHTEKQIQEIIYNALNSQK